MSLGPVSTREFYPNPSKDALREAFVGRNLNQVPTPAAVLDRSIVKRNCERMLEACQSLGLDFRPHVKSHKTLEIAKLQLGEKTDQAKIVVSTIAEAEELSDFLQGCRKPVNLLYGVPLPPSQIQRLAQLRNQTGPGSVHVLIDHPSQLESADFFLRATNSPLQIIIKVDTGYHRAGIEQEGSAFQDLILRVQDYQDKGSVCLVGFYSHAGHSYGVDASADALQLLITEIEILEKAAHRATRLLRQSVPESQPCYLLSVGATPTATSIENLLSKSSSVSVGENSLSAKFHEVIERAKRAYTVELHAGVYPLLDLQQISTCASPSALQESTIGTADIALTILAEVVSIYNERSSQQALIAAGTLAMGREPCKSNEESWGLVSDWRAGSTDYKTRRSGWKVSRISQEHGIVTEEHEVAGKENRDPFSVGQKVRIWPNHACIAGACYGWYLVVDSNLPERRRDEIVDVWVRYRGW